jgi:hypothetical protein
MNMETYMKKEKKKKKCTKSVPGCLAQRKDSQSSDWMPCAAQRQPTRPDKRLG